MTSGPHTPLGTSFHTTRWSAVLAAGSEDAPSARAALSDLCAAYWQPLYAFLRRSGTQPDEAMDRVQGFLARLLEKCDLATDPARGRFRSYLLGALKHFVANVRRAERAPAGSPRAPFSLDAEDAEHRYASESTDHATPERLFERQWATTVLDRAVARLRAEYEGRGRGPLYAALSHALTGSSDLPYAALAAQLDVSESAIKVTVHRMRSRLRELVREEVAQTVDGPGEVDDEMRQLLAALSA